MNRPDRADALVLALIVFSLYLDSATVLTSLALASLPLGTIGSVWAGSTAIVMLMLFDVVILNLRLIRQRKHAQMGPLSSYFGFGFEEPRTFFLFLLHTSCHSVGISRRSINHKSRRLHIAQAEPCGIDENERPDRFARAKLIIGGD